MFADRCLQYLQAGFHFLGGEKEKSMLQMDGFILIGPQCPTWIIVCGDGHFLWPLPWPCCSPGLLLAPERGSGTAHGLPACGFPCTACSICNKGQFARNPCDVRWKASGQHLIYYFFIHLVDTRASPAALGLSSIQTLLFAKDG